jgi:hypothetical protein
MPKVYGTHHLSQTRFYKIYHLLKQRCNNPKASKFHLWGGKGIRNQWRTFEDFKRDMYPSYLRHVEKYGERNTTIERTDGDKDYSKANCRWATYKEQNTNRKNVLKFKNLSVTQWAEKLKLDKHLIYLRLKRGWKFERAINEPKHNYLARTI